MKISKFDFKKFLKHNKRNTFCFGFASQLLPQKLRTQSVEAEQNVPRFIAGANDNSCPAFGF
ncbi:hypothetical protein CAMRE0001_0570 [Campylobacter rectus RM3267]|uniref:Uncharacterized protein n=1 Tax=Campylobacter rectus RM3267 TaxID=553218 RepID=B9D5P6_CAMRE|nr:hypothetical protein CAMRE0001_0570 [Campylobacter rectus RM3267]